MVAFGNFRSDAQIPLRECGLATPSITRITGGPHTRSRPFTAIGSRVQLDARSPPQVVDMGARTSPIKSPPPVYSHPFNERIGHNFSHGHQNLLCDHNSESTLRDGRQGAGFAEFRFGAKIPSRSVCTSTPTAVPSCRTRIFIRPGVETIREA
ncbi:hypothetical protein Taro_056272, partial [Colocasia esculenta]|nr:hypothetical protein [Colocasia esculenta]